MDFRAWEAQKLATEIREKKRKLQTLIRRSTTLFFLLRSTYVEKENKSIEKMEGDIITLGFDKVVISERDQVNYNWPSYIEKNGITANPFDAKDIHEKFFSKGQ